MGQTHCQAHTDESSTGRWKPRKPHWIAWEHYSDISWHWIRAYICHSRFWQAHKLWSTPWMAIYEGIESIAILDSGAGISVATKSIWEKWGRPIVWSTRLNLQLADGSLENPIGLLENITVTSCGIKYEHTFAIVDFGRNTNYEVILGRPFIRQFRMV